jgi:hypothetical protein
LHAFYHLFRFNQPFHSSGRFIYRLIEQLQINGFASPLLAFRPEISTSFHRVLRFALMLAAVCLSFRHLGRCLCFSRCQ